MRIDKELLNISPDKLDIIADKIYQNECARKGNSLYGGVRMKNSLLSE